jgi:hypothetical protein
VPSGEAAKWARASPAQRQQQTLCPGTTPRRKKGAHSLPGCRNAIPAADARRKRGGARAELEVEKAKGSGGEVKGGEEGVGRGNPQAERMRSLETGSSASKGVSVIRMLSHTFPGEAQPPASCLVERARQS